MSRDKKPTVVDAEYTGIADDISRNEARTRAKLSSQQALLSQRIEAAAPRLTDLELMMMRGIELSCRLALDGRDDDARDVRALVTAMIGFAKDRPQAHAEAVSAVSASINAHVDAYVENVLALGERWESKNSGVSAAKSANGRSPRTSEYKIYRDAIREARRRGEKLDKTTTYAICAEAEREAKEGDPEIVVPELPEWNTMRTWLRPRK